MVAWAFGFCSGHASLDELSVLETAIGMSTTWAFIGIGFHILFKAFCEGASFFLWYEVGENIFATLAIWGGFVVILAKMDFAGQFHGILRQVFAKTASVLPEFLWVEQPVPKETRL